MTRPMRSHAGVVVLHDATPGDSSALQGLRSASIIYAGDGLPGQDGMPGSGLLPVDGARVAEDETGLLGSYGLLVRTGAAGVEAELEFLLVARRAAASGVARLLIVDAQQQAALCGVHAVTVLVRPPMDVPFRAMGARAVGIVAPGCGISWPRLHMLLPV